MSVAETANAPGAARRSLRSAGLKSSLHRVATLSEAEREEMWSLFARFYDGTSRSRFRTDLAAKDMALVLRDEHGRLQGFSTLELSSAELEGGRVRVLFSGDTIIERAHWGSQALAFSWLRLAGVLKRLDAGVPLYWFLIVKGQRTYRYLPTFAKRFVPDWRGEAPADLHRLLDGLARKRFGEAWDPTAGVIRFVQSQGHLAHEWARISDRELERPDVRFFLERNPGYARGDELACLCELTEENLRPMARRIFEGKAEMRESADA